MDTIEREVTRAVKDTILGTLVVEMEVKGPNGYFTVKLWEEYPLPRDAAVAITEQFRRDNLLEGVLSAVWHPEPQLLC